VRGGVFGTGLAPRSVVTAGSELLRGLVHEVVLVVSHGDATFEASMMVWDQIWEMARETASGSGLEGSAAKHCRAF
jgi:hypothetical protein